MTHRQRLGSVCREAYDKGIIIVAADHNEGYDACYPAYFPFVFRCNEWHYKVTERLWGNKKFSN